MYLIGLINLPDLVLSHEIIKRVEKTKYLGINIDESLSWKEQYKAIKNKLKGDLSSIRKLKNILPQRKIEQVYKALFESHLRYGNIGVLFPIPNYPNCNDYRQGQRSR